MIDRACKWAHERMLQKDFIVLDTETTALYDQEIVDIAILDAAGAVIFDSLIKPIERVTEGARAVHHISEEMLAGAPSFAEVWPQIQAAIAGKVVITYNSAFDFESIALSLIAHGLDIQELQKTENLWHCLMKHYAAGSRWQKLDVALQREGLQVNNTHRALTDAQAAYSLLKHLAEKYEPQTAVDDTKAHKLINYLKEQEATR